MSLVGRVRVVRAGSRVLGGRTLRPNARNGGRLDLTNPEHALSTAYRASSGVLMVEALVAAVNAGSEAQKHPWGTTILGNASGCGKKCRGGYARFVNTFQRFGSSTSRRNSGQGLKLVHFDSVRRSPWTPG
jgi:hypothetical protein